MKKIIIVLILFISFFVVNARPNTYIRNNNNLLVPKDVVVDENNIDSIMKTPAVDEEKKIYDFSDLLTEDEEEDILLKINEYTKNTGIDVCIIIVSDLGGVSINDYAYNFYDYNDFLDSGVVFVIYNNDLKTSVFMGNNGPKDSVVFTTYTNARINEILKYIYDNDIKSGEYYRACLSFIKLIDGFYIKDYGINNNSGSRNLILIIVISLSVTVLIVLAMLVLFQKNNRVKNIIADALDKNEMIVKCLYDRSI